MYLAHFGLNSAPFRLTPDAEFFYAGAERGAILGALGYVLTEGHGVLAVVGEVGSGKTMLCRLLGARLPDSVEVLYLAHPSLGPEDVLHAVAAELRLAGAHGQPRVEVLRRVHAALLERHRAGRRVVLFVEEAQLMAAPALEELRLLSNLETATDKLLQITLFGQPELDARLDTPECRALKDRVTHRFWLPPLSAADTGAYLACRLQAAGHRGPPLFSAAAARRLARTSRGLLRRVNVLADKALLAAYAAGSAKVRHRHVRAALRDAATTRPSRLRPALVGVAVAALMVSAASALVPLWSRPPAVLSAASGLVTPGLVTPGLVTPGPATGRNGGTAALATTAPSARTPPSTAAATGSLSRRLATGHAWLAAQDGAEWTVQLMTSTRPDRLETFLGTNARSLGADAARVSATRLAGRRAYAITYGRYPTRAAALQAVSRLPAALAAHGPYVRRIGEIYAEAARDA